MKPRPPLLLFLLHDLKLGFPPKRSITETARVFCEGRSNPQPKELALVRYYPNDRPAC